MPEETFLALHLADVLTGEELSAQPFWAATILNDPWMMPPPMRDRFETLDASARRDLVLAAIEVAYLSRMPLALTLTTLLVQAHLAEQRAAARTFHHPEYSVYGAIERCNDLDKLRAAAIAYHKAMQGQHELISHGPELNPCERCDQAVEHGDNSYACRLYRGRQKQYRDALRIF